MKRIIIICFFAVSIFSMYSCGGSHYVTAQPTVPVYERGVAPGANYVWVDGDWYWSGNRYVYRNGYWARPKASRVWVTGSWVNSPTAYYWRKGHWHR